MFKHVGEQNDIEVLAAIEWVTLGLCHVGDVGLGQTRPGFRNGCLGKIDSYHAVALQSEQFRSVDSRTASGIEHAQAARKPFEDPWNFRIGDLEVGALGRFHTEIPTGNGAATAARLSRSAILRARSMQTSILMYSNSATRPHCGMPICSKYVLARCR